MKNKIKKIVMMLIVCLLSAIMVVTASAGPVTGKYYLTDQQSTRISGTTGYTAADYSGYHYVADEEWTVFLHGECYGGPQDTFYTSVYMKFVSTISGISDKGTTTSEDTNSRLVERSYSYARGVVYGTGNGYMEESTKAYANSSDNWTKIYSYYWTCDDVGWRPL